MTNYTPMGQALTDVILETFRLNGALLAWGDDLVRDLGLTSARWQVLGAVALQGRPMTVAQIARRMGLSRQAVQRVANDLAKGGLLEFIDNPDHKRARLLSLSDRGQAAYDQADARYARWVNALAETVDPEAAQAALQALRAVHDRCQANKDDQP